MCPCSCSAEPPLSIGRYSDNAVLPTDQIKHATGSALSAPPGPERRPQLLLMKPQFTLIAPICPIRYQSILHDLQDILLQGCFTKFKCVCLFHSKLTNCTQSGRNSTNHPTIVHVYTGHLYTASCQCKM